MITIKVVASLKFFSQGNYCTKNLCAMCTGTKADFSQCSKPKTIDELKCNIRAEISATTPEMLANVMQNARKRAAFCISNGGGHLIDVVF